MASAAFTGGASVTYADGAALLKTGSGKFCLEYSLGGQEYERDYIYSPGVDGAGSKTSGYRNQRIELKVMYVDSSESAVATAAQADNVAMASGGAMALTLASVAFVACFLESFDMEQPTSTGFGSVIGRATVVVNAKRIS